MIDVLLINPPYLNRFSREQRSPGVTKSGTLYYPMWLAYATGKLEDAGYRCRLIDAVANQLTPEDIRSITQAEQPRLIVVSTSTPSIDNDAGLAVELKKIAGAVVVLVGPHVSALHQNIIEQYSQIDAVARGEYEEIIQRLADAITHQTPWDMIKGLTWRSNNRVIVNPSAPSPENLDAMRFVSRVYHDHLHIAKYRYSSCQHPVISLVTSRGCINHCIFCVYTQIFSGRVVRQRSIDNIIAEIRYLQLTFPEVKEIMFEDDTFTYNLARVRAFCQQLLEEKIRLTWSANARVQVDYDTLRLMKRAGCRLLCVGYESGSQQILNRIKKGTTVEMMHRFSREARRAGILIHGCFMFGHPDETPATMQQTLDLAKKINPDSAQFFPVMAYPGTELFAWAKSHGYLTTTNFRSWVTAEGWHNCVVSRPGLTADDLTNFCRRARKEFYLRPKYLSQKVWQVIRYPSELTRNVLAFKNLFRHL
ncbi:MAG: radical SAM protein [Patescibacteria group bacterium]|nr:radical SAM protein [Patescibacteria group bacterium]